jgi:hypothetical protein
MSLQALINLSKIRDLDEGQLERLSQARVRQRAFDEGLERKVAAKRVTEELLNKTCGL